MLYLFRSNEVPTGRSKLSQRLYVREIKDFFFIQKKQFLYFFSNHDFHHNHLPHFLGLGGQKCGTSWLDFHLGNHPELFLPPNRESIHYFDNKFHLPLKWYLNKFIGGEKKIRGETMPDYGVLPEQRIAYIYNLIPHLKSFIVLRDPIERAWSHARMSYSNWGYNLNDVTIDEWKKQFTSIYSLTKGDYASIINNWLKYFPDESLLIIFFEEIDTQPVETLNKIAAFLDVSPFDQTVVSRSKNKINQGQEFRIPEICLSFLKKLYKEKIYILSERYGGSANDWKVKYYE